MSRAPRDCRRAARPCPDVAAANALSGKRLGSRGARPRGDWSDPRANASRDERSPEVLAADRPLVLILEDLQWSDHSTLDLISYLARQRQAARLMLIGTYRTVELIVSGHPLK